MASIRSFAPLQRDEHEAGLWDLTRSLRKEIQVHPIAALRTALIGQWVLAVASVVLFSLEAPGLPEPLKEFYASEELAPTTPFDAFVGWYAGAWVLGSFVGKNLLVCATRPPGG